MATLPIGVCKQMFYCLSPRTFYQPKPVPCPLVHAILYPVSLKTAKQTFQFKTQLVL